MQNVSRADRCENIYQWIMGNTDKDLNSIHDFSKALHLIGQNPSQCYIEHCWNKYGGKISFGDFLHLADEDDSELKMDDLLDAFAAVAHNSAGIIKKNILMDVLTTKGECMTVEEVEALLSEYQDEVDYLKLCRSMLDLANRLRLPVDYVDGWEEKISYKTFTRKKRSNYEYMQKTPCTTVNVQGWNVISIHGCFYIGADRKIQCPQYILTVPEETASWINIHPDDELGVYVDTELLLFAEQEGGRRFIGCTQVKDGEGRYCLRSTLKAGQYLIVPFTTSCHTMLLAETEFPADSAFPGTLRLAFNILDRDGDGLLNYSEFSAFQARVSGRNTSQEEWHQLMRNSLNNHGITEEEFVDKQMQQETATLCQILTELGFGEAFQTCNFTITVHCETGRASFCTLPVTDSSALIERTLSRMVEMHGTKSCINNFKDLSLHILKLPHRVSIAVSNKSHSTLAICFDCSESQNCLSHRGVLDCVVQVPSKTCMIVQHLIQDKKNLPWAASCKETLFK